MDPSYLSQSLEKVVRDTFLELDPMRYVSGEGPA